MIDFADNLEAAEAILNRAADLCFAPALDDRMGLLMDIMAADGCNGNPPLDCDKLVRDFDDGNFLHDIGGIYRHLDRSTGQLTGCFLPRCACPDHEADHCDTGAS
jgi:hypothetical protein